MAREEKAQIIEHLTDVFARSSISILADYRGLKTADLTALRRKLGAAGVGIEVVKNSLARIAAEKAGKTDAGKLFEGPVVLVSGFDDVTEPVKLIQSYITETKVVITIKSGFLKEKALSIEDIATLSKLPGREILIAQVVGGMQAPISGLVYCLSGPLQGLQTVLQGRMKQLEAG